MENSMITIVKDMARFGVLLFLFWSTSCGSKHVSGDKCSVVNYTYQILETKHHKESDTYFVLLKVDDDSGENVEKIGKEIKEKMCKGQCKLNLYGNERAYKMEKEMWKEKDLVDKELTQTTISREQYHLLMSLITKKYYMAVASHVLGRLEYKNGWKFEYYPYRTHIGGYHTIVYLSEE